MSNMNINDLNSRPNDAQNNLAGFGAARKGGSFDAGRLLQGSDSARFSGELPHEESGGGGAIVGGLANLLPAGIALATGQPGLALSRGIQSITGGGSSSSNAADMEGHLDSMKSNFNEIFVMQGRIQSQSQIHNMLTNASKTDHESQMAAIKHIKA